MSQFESPAFFGGHIFPLPQSTALGRRRACMYQERKPSRTEIAAILATCDCDAHCGPKRLRLCDLGALRSGAKKQPKEKGFRPDFPQTSTRHSCGRPGSRALGRPAKSWKNKHLGADIHDPNARTSGAKFWEGDATRHFSVKKKGLSVKRREAIQ